MSNKIMQISLTVNKDGVEVFNNHAVNPQSLIAALQLFEGDNTVFVVSMKLVDSPMISAK